MKRVIPKIILIVIMLIIGLSLLSLGFHQLNHWAYVERTFGPPIIVVGVIFTSLAFIGGLVILRSYLLRRKEKKSL